MPSGDQQFRALLGHGFVLADGGRGSDVDRGFEVDLRLTYGVHERLTWATPLVFGWRLWRDLGSELVLLGGVDGVGWGEAWLRPSRGDPRQPNRRVSSWLVRGMVGAAARHVLSERLTFETAVRARQGLYGGRLEDYETAGSATLVADLGDSVSLALSMVAHAEYDADEARLRRGWTLGGDSVGLVPVPTIALHVRDNLDLVAWASVGYLVGAEVWHAAVAAGFAWHGRAAEKEEP